MITTSDPNVRHSDTTRLGGQNGEILARLRQGPATNHELAYYSLKYTSRISDLRAAGYVITCIRGEKGTTSYRLEGLKS